MTGTKLMHENKAEMQVKSEIKDRNKMHHVCGNFQRACACESVPAYILYIQKASFRIYDQNIFQHKTILKSFDALHLMSK